MSMIYATCLIIMFILSQTTITFSQFPSKHLGNIVYGLCFAWVNVSSIRCNDYCFQSQITLLIAIKRETKIDDKLTQMSKVNRSFEEFDACQSW